MFMQVPDRHLEGEELETVDITLRLGKENFEMLTQPGKRVTVNAIWLTKQPDGTYALGLRRAHGPIGSPRKVENDDAKERTRT